jgi:histidyl-tRNA synthetase
MADRVLRAPEGMLCVLPPEWGRWSNLVARFTTWAQPLGYGLLSTPMVERCEVFAPVDASTVVAPHELCDFVDRGGQRPVL